MKVDINLVKELRAITHAPLKDCTTVLAEANWDINLAQDLLRKKGLLNAAKKADRETNHWVVKFVTVNGVTAWIKVLCETDFVAKNEKFQGLVDTLLDMVIAADWEFDTDSVSSTLKESLETYLKEHVWIIGENMNLSYIYRTTKNAYIYNHNGNSLSAIIFYESEGNVDEIAKEVALQVAAMNPTYISIDDVPADRKEELKNEYTLELKDSDKPEEIKQKIIEWKIYKTLQDDILLEQISIRDWAKKVKDIMSNKMTISDILRVVVG